MSDIEADRKQVLHMIKAYVEARKAGGTDERKPNDPGFMNAVRDQMVVDGLIDYFADGTVNITEKGRKWKSYPGVNPATAHVKGGGE
jgi:hypothetical protein